MYKNSQRAKKEMKISPRASRTGKDIYRKASQLHTFPIDIKFWC